MALGDGTRQWVRGTLAKIAASSAVLGSGELLVDEAGGVYGGDGTTPLSALKRLARINEVLTPAAAAGTYAQFLTPLGSGQDDAPRINTALATASAFGASRAVVLVGDFNLASTIYLPSNATLDARRASLTAKAGWSGYSVQTLAQKIAVLAPSGLALSSSTSAGTLAAGTYSYQVSALTSGGETMGCSRATVTTTATGSVTLTWAAPTIPTGGQTITGYRVWGRSGVTGTERTLLASVSAATLTWTDDGSVTPDATPTPSGNSTFGRTADVTVIGGKWDGNRANRTATYNWVNSGGYAGHIFDLQHIDRCTIRDAQIVGGIKWGIAVADFTHLTTENIYYDTGADGAHVVGPGLNWTDTNSHGRVGDDLIGMSLAEWPGYAVSEGDLTDITIRNVQGVDAPSAVRMLKATRRTFRNVLIDGVIGEYTKYRDAATGNYTTIGNGVVFCDTDQQDVTRAGGTAVNLRFRRILPDTHQSNVLRLAGSFTDVFVDDVVTLGDDKAALSVVSASIRILDARRVRSAFATSSAIAFGGGTIEKVTLDAVNMDLDTITLGSGLVSIVNTAITDMACTDSSMVSGIAAASGSLIYAYGTTVIKMLRVRGSRVANVGGTVYADGGTIERLTVQAPRQTGGVSVVRTKKPTRVTVRDYLVDGTISNGVVYFIGGSSGPSYVDTGGDPNSTNNGSGVTLSWTNEGQAIHPRSFDTRGSATLAARAAQNTMFNTNASISCGVGPIICDGTTWKHLYTAATY